MGKDKGEGKAKRPPSAYLLYSMDKRPELQAANPSLKLPDISKKLGAQWKALSASEKRPYEEKAQKQKAAYEAANPSKGGKTKKSAAKSKGKKAASSEDESED
jgi:hypothetical protein